MMNTALISAFLTYTLITAITPGPNNILALSSVSAFGLKRSSRVILGMSVGFLVIMLLCGLLSYTLINVLPALTYWMKFVGAAYILWLALKIARSNPNVSSASEGLLSFSASFWLQFANVKIILYGITALTTFVLPTTREIIWVTGASLLLAVIGVFGNLCWALAGHLFQVLFRRYGRLLNLILAALLVWIAVDMIR